MERLYKRDKGAANGGWEKARRFNRYRDTHDKEGELGARVLRNKQGSNAIVL